MSSHFGSNPLFKGGLRGATDYPTHLANLSKQKPGTPARSISSPENVARQILGFIVGVSLNQTVNINACWYYIKKKYV